MEEYLDKLISQIRCKKARPYIEDEYRAHLEDQINANIEEGMTDEEAEINAVLDMGDPIEVGISMDKIHRPQLAWDMIFIVGIISVLAILIQWIFVSQISNGNYTIDGISQYTTLTGEINSAGEAINTTFGYVYSFSVGDFILIVILGIVLMGIVYFIDYTAIAKYSKIIGLIIISAGMYSLLFGARVNGTYFGLGPVKISATTLMMLFVPIFGAIIFKYHSGGVFSLLKCIVWMIVPTIIAFRLPSLLPFFSAGGSNTILCYYLIGLVISIYRYKNIYPCFFGNKMITKKQSL